PRDRASGAEDLRLRGRPQLRRRRPEGPPQLARRRAGRQGGRRATGAGARRGAARGGGARLTDEVRLTIPAEEDFRRVAHLVLGGLAVRLDLTFEVLEDLQLALDSLLERRDDERDVTVAVVLEPGELRTSVGPFEG